MPGPKLTDERLRYYIHEWDFTPEELAQMFVLPLEEVTFRIAKLRRDEAKKKAEAGTDVPKTPQEKERARRVMRAEGAAAQRPYPPEEMQDEDSRVFFAPAPDVRDWLFKTFIVRDSPLYNAKHSHLLDAHVGVLWTTVGNNRGNRRILGTAEIPHAQGGKWSKARADYQLMQWFGDVPDFLITLDATYAAECSDWSWCALCEHELLHCAQAVDIWGLPRFSNKTGLPIFAIHGHDVEQFTDVALRYGADAAGVQALVDAARDGPLFGAAQISGACGACGAVT